MITQTQTQPSAPDPKPFGTLLTEAVRDVQSGLTALQTAEGQELAAGEQVAAAEAALTDARTAKAGARRDQGLRADVAEGGVDRPGRHRRHLPGLAVEVEEKTAFVRRSNRPAGDPGVRGSCGSPRPPIRNKG